MLFKIVIFLVLLILLNCIHCAAATVKLTHCGTNTGNIRLGFFPPLSSVPPSASDALHALLVTFPSLIHTKPSSLPLPRCFVSPLLSHPPPFLLFLHHLLLTAVILHSPSRALVDSLQPIQGFCFSIYLPTSSSSSMCLFHWDIKQRSSCSVA